MDRDESNANNRKTIFAEASTLKKLAANYHHPEVGVESVDSTCSKRTISIDWVLTKVFDEKERKTVLAEVSTLKKLATTYHHPEVGVKSVHSTCFERNYFKFAEVVDAGYEQALADTSALNKRLLLIITTLRLVSSLAIPLVMEGITSSSLKL